MRMVKKAKSNRMNLNAKFKYFAILSLCVLVVLLAVGSSAWNLHLRIDGMFGTSGAATFELLTGDGANEVFLNNHIAYGDSDGTINVDGCGIAGVNGNIVAYTYGGTAYTPHPTVKNAENAAVQFDLDAFSYTYVKLAKPNLSGEGYTAVARETLDDAPFHAGIYQVTIRPILSEEDSIYASNIGTATIIYAIKPATVTLWIKAQQSFYGDNKASNISSIEVEEVGNTITTLGDDINDLYSLDIVAGVGVDVLTVGTYDSVGTDVSLDYQIEFRGKAVTGSSTEFLATNDYTILPKELYVKIHNNECTYGDAIDYSTLTAELTNGSTLVGSDDIYDVIKLYIPAYDQLSSGARLNVGVYPILLTDKEGSSKFNPNYDVKGVIGEWNNDPGNGEGSNNLKAGIFEVKQREIGLEWSNINLTYNGTTQTPTVLATNVCFGDTCVITQIDGGERNVNAIDADHLLSGAEVYVATASALSNSNYKLPTERTQEYKIMQLTAQLSWSPNTFVYNGDEQLPTVTVTNICSSDVVTVTVTGAKKDANLKADGSFLVGKNYYVATATALSNSNYKLPTVTTFNFTISPKEVILGWTNTTLIYNGINQKPTAITTGLCTGDTVSVTVIGEQKNANVDASGTLLSGRSYYVATVTALDNENYKLPIETTHNFVILPKTIGLLWSNDNFTYNKIAQVPTVTPNGLCEGDTVTVTVEGAEVNANANASGILLSGKSEYTARATAIDDTNYTLPTTGATKNFVIKQKEVGLAWTGSEFTYNGETQSPTAVSTGLIEGDSSTVTVTGGQKDANLDAEGNLLSGKQVYVAVASALSNTNYCLPTANTHTFTIAPKAISLEWTGTVLEYNSLEQKPTATATNVCIGDSVTVSVDGARIDANADLSGDLLTGKSDYSAIAVSVDNTNYKLSGLLTTTFRIKVKGITIIWGNTDLTYNASEQSPLPTTSDICVSDASNCTLNFSGKQTNANANSQGTLLSSKSYYVASVTSLGGSRKDNYVLVNNLTIEYVIKQALVEEPNEGINSFVYTGSEITYTINPSSLYAITDNVATDVGTYHAKIVLNDKNNYAWKMSKDINDLDYVFTITKATVNTADLSWKCVDEVLGEAIFINGNMIKGTGNLITVSLDLSSELQSLITSGVLSLVYSGNYSESSYGDYDATATFVLVDTDNYNLVGSTVYTLSWSIISIIFVAMPEENNTFNTSLVYSAQDKNIVNNAFLFDGNSYSDYSENNAITVTISYKKEVDSSTSIVTETRNAGYYTITFSIQDVTLYAWSDGTNDDIVFDSFHIEQLTAELSWGVLTFVYDGSEKTPTVTVSNVCTGDECLVLAIGYKTRLGSDLVSAPINVGTYYATVLTLSNDNYKLPTSKQKLFSITEVIIPLPIVNTIFMENGTETIAGFVYSRYDVLYDGSSKVFFTNTSEFSGYVNSFTASSTNLGENAVGLVLTDSINYKWEDGTKDNKYYLFVIANPVCHNLTKNTDHLTVESALSAAVSGDILYLIPGIDANSVATPDKKEYTIRNDCEIKSGVTLILPTDSSTLSSVTSSNTSNYLKGMYEASTENISKKHAYADSSKYLRCTLNVANDITLTNNGTLIVSGYLSAGNSNGGRLGQTAYSYAQIKLGSNASIIQNNSSAQIYCYGYIWEQTVDNGSHIQLNSGKLHVPYVLDDYRGFSFSWAMTDGAINNQRCSAFNQFELCNIDSLMTIKYGVQVTGYVNVLVKYDSMSVNQVFPKQLSLVGTTSSFLIQLTNSTYSYLEYKFNSSTSIAKVNIYGGASMNPISLNISASGLSVDLSTTNAYFPVSYHQNIDLYRTEGQSENAVYNFSKQRIKLLPGTTFVVNENCQVTGNELIVYTAFFDGTKGNGESSSNGSPSETVYPQKDGAVFRINGNASVTFTKIAGTVYKSDSATLSYTNSTIIAKEAWMYGSSGKINPAWNIKDYLEIREQLQILSLEDLSKPKLYVGLNTFTVYNSYLPAIRVNINGTSYTVDTYQKVIVLDSTGSYQIDLLRNVYKAFRGTTLYTLDSTISYSATNAIITAVNSKRSISSTPVDEFRVQSITVECTTPLVNNEIPLYVDANIQLRANVVDIEKVYNKTITWRSSNTSIATVDSSGKVTGRALGTVTIYATCSGVEAAIELEVIEQRVEILPITKITITDNKNNTSEKSVATISNNVCHGKYDNGSNITFTVNIFPEGAPYSEIEWTFRASAAGRQYMNDKTKTSETVKGVTSVVIHVVSGSGKDADYASLTCKVTPLAGGSPLTVTFGIHHNADACLTESTLITMADGSVKKVEDLKIGDMLLVFNHETGRIEPAPLLANIHAAGDSYAEYKVISLNFSNGETLKIVSDHGLYDKDLNKYVYIEEDNYTEYIGHTFVSIRCVDGKQVIENTVLESVTVALEYTRVYNPASVWHINLIANNMLTLSAGMTNLFAYDETMRYDQELMQQDIETYGLYTYEDFKDYITPDVFEVFPFKYYKVAVGKGEFTYEKLLWLIDFYYDPDSIRVTEGTKENVSTAQNENRAYEQDLPPTETNNSGSEDPTQAETTQPETPIPPQAPSNSSGESEGESGGGSNDDDTSNSDDDEDSSSDDESSGD